MKEAKKHNLNLYNKPYIINSLLIGLIIGVLIFAIFRFTTYKPDHNTHYHANWQVWINGEQQKFTQSSLYQETASCNVNDENNPLHRAHMHDNIYDIIHVHADGVTYNQFLENISSSALTEYLVIVDKNYINNANTKVTYILNGKQLDSLNGVVIKSEDKLLINYGSEPLDELIKRNQAIDNKAKEFNTKQDPLSCSGSHATSLQDRLNAILF